MRSRFATCPYQLLSKILAQTKVDFARRCSELGWAVSGERLNQVYQRFIELADRKKNVYDQDLLAILGAAKPAASELPRAFASSASGD